MVTRLLEVTGGKAKGALIRSLKSCFPHRVMYKRVCAVVAAVMVVAVAGVYIVYFHRPPTANILAANKAKHSRHGLVRKALHGEHPPHAKGGRQLEDQEDYEGDQTPSQVSVNKWDAFIEENNLVSIGELYDKCEGDDQIMLGKVVMMKDEETDGIKARTYLNVTYGDEITGGEMFIECKYNGKDLYSNHWELCTVEDGMKDRIIFCPIKPGKKKFLKDMPIPNYLPKGRYETKAWLTNQDDDIIGCAFSDFTI